MPSSGVICLAQPFLYCVSSNFGLTILNTGQWCTQSLFDCFHDCVFAEYSIKEHTVKMFMAAELLNLYPIRDHYSFYIILLGPF